ncbi:MAG TPA: 16S rRNA (guanine(966)-N(2))-methyltransferase RsmD [Burkholderiales bacterium]|jgi:16S rRNA (guanine(966)-N(2))-methyltransferase RsmD|nr:16S rRNA (guanine(966)-N(2))-methyltransferase RsmD [Burkholderiales bacterium]
MPARSNSVRIIGGEWRRRLIHFPGMADLRPTPDRMRETLFNWLGQDLTGVTCLDLFAGSGALGFEAASRGARQVVMVERDVQIFRALQATHTMLGAVQVELVRADALAFLRSDARRYDVVFLDPPYHLDLLPYLLPLLPSCLDGGSRVYLESDRLPVLPEGYQVLRRSRAGRVHGLLIKCVQP